MKGIRLVRYYQRREFRKKIKEVILYLIVEPIFLTIGLILFVYSRYFK